MVNATMGARKVNRVMFTVLLQLVLCGNTPHHPKIACCTVATMHCHASPSCALSLKGAILVRFK